MDNQTKQLLVRWQSLQKDDGLRRAKSVTRLLWFIGLALVIFITFGIFYQLHPVAISIAAVALGWVIAERNGLRTRLLQWPTFNRYIDWKRVEADLSNEHPDP